VTQILVSRGQYDGYDVLLKASGIYEVDANIDMNGFDILGWDDLIGQITTRELRNNAASMQVLVESGAIFEILINSTIEYTFTNTTLDLLGNILSGIPLMQGLTTTNKIDDTTSGWLYGAPTSHRFAINSVNQLQIADGQISIEDCFIEGTEQSDPSAPTSNKFRIYGRDNGAGKTQVVVRFNTGAIQVISTQP